MNPAVSNLIGRIQYLGSKYEEQGKVFATKPAWLQEMSRGTICSFVRAETGGLQRYERCSLKENLYIRPGQRQDRREENQVSVLTKRHNLVYL